jgi:thymidylate kinase
MNPNVLLLLIATSIVLVIMILFDFDKKLEKKEDHIIGKLIVIEGIEGSGKKKLIEMMKNQMPIEWTYTKEPYLVVDDISSWTKENYQLDRETHVESKILPLLQQNKVLITNRYWMSGCVYDGWEMDSYLHVWPEPDLVIWLDIEPTEEIAEVTKVDLPILQKCRESYKELFHKLGAEHHIPIKRINTTGQSEEAILEEAIQELEKHIPSLKNNVFLEEPLAA